MTVILDSNGTEIKVGDRVVEYVKHYPPGTFGSTDGPTIEVGTVTELTDPDADYDDELGRAVAYGPYVYVSYDDGESDRYTATWNATGPWDDDRDDFTCDDVTVAGERERWAAPKPRTFDSEYEGYAPTDPKSDNYHDRMADLHDSREGK